MRDARLGGSPRVPRGSEPWVDRTGHGTSVHGRLPALEDGRLPVRAHRLRVVDPRPQVELRELAMLLLQPDAVGVARLQVLDQHLAGDLVLAPLRDRKVDLEE